MKAHTVNSFTLAAFAAGSVYLGLWTGACGGSSAPKDGRTTAEITKKAGDMDLARAVDPSRIEGSGATVSGCLQKQSGDFILTRTDLPVSVATTGSDATGGPTPHADEASSPKYRLKAKDETLNPYVGKQVTINGTLAKLESGKMKSDKDYAEIQVSSATLVADSCSAPATGVR
jgi:hypothetical protein